ncbi:FAD/NAD-P-binding domain-containing protein [Dentipellis sp. KUC8613]|nr:FAD/NAD-P-binding domain-containing protein [Dentipellis sp. KUC8613]
MAKTKVIIVGAGIAGPTLAIFLQLKGYDPVIYEKTEGLSEAGISLVLQPNGLRVLSRIPGLIQTIPGKKLERGLEWSLLDEDPGLLTETYGPTRVDKELGFGMFTVLRAKLRQVLVEATEARNIPIHWGHTLVSLEQSENGVRAVFANGTSAEGSFLVGCDGLHSNTRIAVFGNEKANFTGLTQARCTIIVTGGISPTPRFLSEKVTAVNLYGDGIHMVTYPVSDTHSSFAITQREDEARESWQILDSHALEEFKKGPLSQIGFGFGDIVSTAERFVKYGLYDRPELKAWHKGRVLLIGDAAHPTSPHIGQGANQAFEDIYLLASLLQEYNSDASPPSTKTLEHIFTKFEIVRIPRCAALVAGARQQGERRVVHGVQACLKRNQEVRSDQDHFTKRAIDVFRSAPGKW